MSGVYGHINHLYENGDLKFSDLKKIFIAASEGKLEGTEKTDGINIYLSYSTKDNEVRAARNLTQLKGGGITVADMYNFFSEKEKAARLQNKEYNPDIKEAIKDAVQNFEKAVMYLNLESQTKLFGDHINIANFYNCEILDERTPNVINYETKLLVVHRDGHKSVDLRSEEIFELANSTENTFIQKLETLQDNDRTEKFPVQVNAVRHLESISNNEVLNNSINNINKILSNYKLTDDNTINEFLVVRLSRYLNNYDIPPLNKKLIIKKILGVKGLNSNDILKGLPSEIKKHLRNILNTSNSLLKKMIEPIESCVYNFSREILKGVHSLYNLDQTKSNDIIRKKLSNAMNNLGSFQEGGLNLLRSQLHNLNPKKINLPLEGFVFQYNGKTYKFTGDFAPVNKLLNFTNKSYDFNKLGQMADFAIFPGSFKPPHAGHLNAVKELSNLASKVIVIISDPKIDINKRFITEDDEVLTEIPATTAKQIFDEYLKASNLDSRVETIIANNPLKKTKEIISSDPTQSKMHVVSCGPDDKQKNVISYLGRNFKNVKPYILRSKKNMDATDFRINLGRKDQSRCLKYLPDEVQDKNLFIKDIFDMIFNNDLLENIERSTEEIINEIMVKKKNKFCLLSKATKRNLGCYKSKSAVKKREKQVQYFKHMKEVSVAGAVAGYTDNAFMPQKRGK